MAFGTHDPKDVEKLIRYLKALDFLHRREPETISSIILVINYEHDGDGVQVGRFHKLATLMLDDANYREVVRIAKKMILNQAVLLEFLNILNTVIKD